MNTYNLTRLFLLTTFLLGSLPVCATNQTEELEQEALAFLQQHYKSSKPEARTEIKLNPISRKIKLKNCSEPLQFQTPRGNGNRITFRARCPVPLWQLFVTAEIKQFQSVVVSQSSIPRRYVLQANHLILKEIDTTSLRSPFFTSTTQIIGWTTKRSISAGSVITASMLKAPLAVTKGNAVIIEAQRGSVTIRTSATALENGEIGQQIKVQNDRSGRIVRARVIAPGLVKAP